MSVSLSIDEISFHEVVGMVRAHEMELDGVKNHTEVKVAISETTSRKPKNEDKMIQIIRLLQQVLQGVIHGDKKINVSSQGQEAGEPCVNIEGQCQECRGYGHFKTDCPTVKRWGIKCFRCKGIGHTQCECEHNEKKKKERSLSWMSENGSEKEEVLNLFAFGALKDESSTSSDADSDTEIEMDVKKKYHVFYDKWLKLKDKNLRLLQDQAHSRKHGVSQKARQDQSKLVDKLAAVKEMNKSLV